MLHYSHRHFSHVTLMIGERNRDVSRVKTFLKMKVSAVPQRHHTLEKEQSANLAKVDLLYYPHALKRRGLFENVEMTMQLEKMIQPAPYAVYVEVAPYPNCGFTGTYTSRIGPAKDLDEARRKIADDRKAMGDTMGGLIDPVSTKGRTYRVFKAAAWEEVQ